MRESDAPPAPGTDPNLPKSVSDVDDENVVSDVAENSVSDVAAENSVSDVAAENSAANDAENLVGNAADENLVSDVVAENSVSGVNSAAESEDAMSVSGQEESALGNSVTDQSAAINESDFLPYFSKFETFNPNTCSWQTYAERLWNGFELYSVPANKRVQLLIACIGNATFEKLRDLCEPDNPSNKTVDELFGILTQHFVPPSSKYVERVRFAKQQQLDGESVQDFATRVKEAAALCSFPKNWLQQAMITQFLSGVRSYYLRMKLFQCEEDDFDKFVEYALKLEPMVTIESKTETTIDSIFSLPIKTAKSVKKIKRSRPRPKKPVPEQQSAAPKAVFKKVRCETCNYTNHTTAECKWTNANFSKGPEASAPRFTNKYKSPAAQRRMDARAQAYRQNNQTRFAQKNTNFAAYGSSFANTPFAGSGNFSHYKTDTKYSYGGMDYN